MKSAGHREEGRSERRAGWAAKAQRRRRTGLGPGGQGGGNAWVSTEATPALPWGGPGSAWTLRHPHPHPSEATLGTAPNAAPRYQRSGDKLEQVKRKTAGETAKLEGSLSEARSLRSSGPELAETETRSAMITYKRPGCDRSGRSDGSRGEGAELEVTRGWGGGNQRATRRLCFFRRLMNRLPLERCLKSRGSEESKR